MKLRRFYERARCTVGIHRLRGHSDCGDGIHVAPMNPRSRPGPKDWRVCDWCGSSWKGAYDGMAPFWHKTAGPVWRRKLTIPEQQEGER